MLKYYLNVIDHLRQDFENKERQMGLSVLRFEVTEGVAVITMDNPPVNALTPAFLDDFQAVQNRSWPVVKSIVQRVPTVLPV